MYICLHKHTSIDYGAWHVLSIRHGLFWVCMRPLSIIPPKTRTSSCSSAALPKPKKFNPKPFTLLGPKGPCAQTLFSIYFGLKVIPIQVLWGQRVPLVPLRSVSFFQLTARKPTAPGPTPFIPSLGKEFHDECQRAEAFLRCRGYRVQKPY